MTEEHGQQEDRELSLKDYEQELNLRRLKAEDYQALHALGERCFPGMPGWTKEQIESQVRIFPEGQLGIELNGRLIASACSLVVDSSQSSEWHDWKKISDNGTITGHDPEGDTLYGIEIMVDPEFRGMKLSRRLYDERKKLARQMNLMRVAIGGRIPGYSAYADEVSASEYVERVMSKALFDPVLTPQVANGFVLRGLIPNYLPADEESRGYATHLEWTNFEYRKKGRRQFKAVAPVRVTIVQYQMRPIKDFEEFAKQVSFFVETASDYRSDFVLFPELFTLQLLSTVEETRPGLAARQLAEYTPSYLELFASLALRFDVNIIGGSQFTVEGDDLFNVAYLFRRDGSLAKQYKIHVTPNERRWWGVSPGNAVEVFDTDCGKIAIQVCYDVEFPELSRVAAKKGARLLFVPFNTDERNGYLRVRHCAQARSIENHLYVAISGCVGNLPFVENADLHYAQSAIFTPSDFSFSRDAMASEGPSNIENVLVCDLDLELIRRHRQTGTTRNWLDRRTDLYQVHVNREGEEPLII